MRYLLALSLLLCHLAPCMAQSDLVVLKKNKRVVRSYYPGQEIYFESASRPYKGFIREIKNDSLYLVQYDIRQVPTNLGVYMLDTVARYHYAIAHKDITALLKDKGSFVSGSGAALLGGGVLLSTAGLVTWIFAKPDTRYYAPPSLVIGAAAAAGVGYLMMRAKAGKITFGKKYSFDYIRLK